MEKRLIEEIFSICSQMEFEPVAEKTAVFCLDRIFSESSDNGLHLMYDAGKQTIHNRFIPVIGKIANSCSDENCHDCCLNRWCNYYRSCSQKTEEVRNGYIIADFFCGAGGLSYGFHEEGFKVSLANDIQKSCIETYSFNHPEVPASHIICGDINDILSDVRKYKRYENTDVVLGGPPCQGFSNANRQRLIDDPRNHLYKSFIKAVEILQPKFVIMENVRGMLSCKDQIFEDYNSIGYKVSARLLYAQNFGVPQNRERAIFIANRIGIDNDAVFARISELCNEQKKTVLNDALFGLPELQHRTLKNQAELDDPRWGYTIRYLKLETNEYVKTINNNRIIPLLFNHKARYNNERDIEIFRRLNPGDKSDDPKIADIMPYTRRSGIFKDKYYKLVGTRISKTITAHMKFDCNMYIHPTQARGLTPREAARVQSYPDDYFFRGPYTKTYMQVGNSVPPLMSRIIAKVISEFMEATHGSI